MPRSSKALLSTETIIELESQFYNFLDSLSSDERKKFFAEFLTNEEKMMMYKRLALYWCLLEGYSLAKIQQMIGVTHDTTRVYNKKKNTLSDEFKSLVQRIAKNDAMEEGMQTKTTAPHVEEVKEEVMAEQKEPEIVDNEMSTEEIELKEEIQEATESLEKKEEEKIEEKMEEPAVEDAHNNIWAVEHPSTDENPLILESEAEKMGSNEEKMEEKVEEKKDDNDGMMPSESKDKDESSDEDEDTGKKKSGIAKFFGF